MTAIILIDDHDLVRFSIKALLEDRPHLKIVGEGKTGEEAIELVSVLNPDLVIMDLSMPGIGGVSAVMEILKSHPQLKTIVVSAYEADPTPELLIKAGVAGYVTKKGDLEELIIAVEKVLAGQKYISPVILRRMSNQKFKMTETPFAKLTQRERQVVIMVGRGATIQEMMEATRLAAKTLNAYRNRIFEKLDIKNDVELTRLALRYGILDNEPFPT